MPVDDDYDARALALPVDDERDSPERGPSPIWSRRSASFRQNRPRNANTSRWRQMLDPVLQANRKLNDYYETLSPVKKVIWVVGGFSILIATILLLIFNERIFHALLPLAKKWRDIPAGWIILWVLIFTVSFPPLIGYSWLMTIAGFVYGFPNG